MWSIISKKPPKLIGVDISSTSVKVLELSKQGDIFQVEAYSIAPLVAQQDVQDINILGSAVKLAVTQSGTSCRNAIIAIPSSLAITKIIQLDANLDQEDIEAQVYLEADRYIPYPIDEVSLDFQIQDLANRKSDKLDVLIAASRTKNVAHLVKILQVAGLTTKIVDIDTYALERASYIIRDSLPNKGYDKTIAIIDVGTKLATVTILHNLVTLYTREEVFGGKPLTMAIQQQYSLLAKSTHVARDSRGESMQHVLPFWETLIALIQRSLQLFFSTSRYNTIDHIVLIGEGAILPGLAIFLSQRLSITCTVANPFMDMVIPKHINCHLIAIAAPALTVCCGLALRNFFQ